MGSPDFRKGTIFISVAIEEGQAGIRPGLQASAQPASDSGWVANRSVPDEAAPVLPIQREFGHCVQQATPIAQRPLPAHDPCMRVVVTSNNPVRLSFLTVLLADAGIEAVVLDGHTSVLEGSAGAIPRRLVVPTEDYPRACRLLRDAGEW